MDSKEDMQKKAFEVLIQETVAMYHCFRSIIENTNTGKQLTTNELGILLCLSDGRLTIPQLVERSPFSRQYVQKVVTGLTNKRQVERLENSAHKRSFFIQLTDEGKAQMEQIRGEGYHLLNDFRGEFDEAHLLELAESLKEIRQKLEKVKE
ncbi:MarR family winged helix-turn-helix transcriptional regulator [Pseudalkalibacillus sp. A8]|uniref:MarR family winged helix-turn-helix transcriptional regulator n=1 Tax=Pseudalkalibacillus sp. A8 TaxID=3382641 RepID=UPI0038B641ED